MKATTQPFRSNFYLWNGVSAIFFSNCITNTHSHNTLQIIVDLQSQFRCRIADGGWSAYKNLVIREEVPHQLDTAGSVQLIIYLDTATTAAKDIKARLLPAALPAAAPQLNIFEHIQPGMLQQMMLRPDALSLHKMIQQILLAIAGRRQPPKHDPRIQTIEQAILSSHPDDIRIPILAGKVHLSESRLRALFKEQTGVPLYKYILWSKIRFAMNRIMNGSPVNDAAWEAGFTDNSHFHKMLVSMFGISPSQFLRDHRSMEILTCDASPLSFITKVYNDQGGVTATYGS